VKQNVKIGSELWTIVVAPLEYLFALIISSPIQFLIFLEDVNC